MSHEFAHANMAHSWLLSGTFIVKHLYSFIAPSSLLANNIASANAAASAIGPAYITPSIPIINEKTTIRRHKKQHLSGQGHDDSKLCFSDRCKKS